MQAKQAKRGVQTKKRCEWAKSPIMIHYHDTEWGVPLRGDRRLFEFLILEGAQAGLSWETILNKRDNYRRAFDQFEVEKIARYGARDTARLLADAGIVRNRLKVAAAIQNAKATLVLLDEGKTLTEHLWSFTGGKPIVSRPRTLKEIRCQSDESDAMSRDLLSRGFKFVGTKICYAFMQATGMANDHVRGCFRGKS